MSGLDFAILGFSNVIEKESKKNFEIQRPYNRSKTRVEYKNGTAARSNRDN
jgi:hypothetical protein